MRNPERIDTFCAELAKIWKEKVPDWRFGQLFYNLQAVNNQDFYYIEDNDFLELIKQYMNRL